MPPIFSSSVDSPPEYIFKLPVLPPSFVYTFLYALLSSNFLSISSVTRRFFCFYTFLLVSCGVLNALFFFSSCQVMSTSLRLSTFICLPRLFRFVTSVAQGPTFSSTRMPPRTFFHFSTASSATWSGTYSSSSPGGLHTLFSYCMSAMLDKSPAEDLPLPPKLRSIVCHSCVSHDYITTTCVLKKEKKNEIHSPW